MEMKDKLLKEYITTPTYNQKEYFIQRYNHVINVYNTSINTPDQELDSLDNNPFFEKINRIVNKTIVKIAFVLLLAFAPIINLFILGFLVFYYLFLLREGKKHKRNLIKVPDPMETFYFLPEICFQLGKNCTTMTIKTKDLEGFTFNTDLYQELKSKENETDQITVTIYDQYFYDSYHLFRKEQYRTAAWILLSTILIALDVIFYVELLELK